MSVEIKGLNEAMKEINSKISKIKSANPKALKDVCFDLLGKAQEKAPVDTGDLRGSGFSEINNKEGIVGFSASYALRQHESLEYRHPKGGEAKYLEKPFKQNNKKYINHIVNSVKKVVE